jgi:hypothetical protein
MRTPEERLKVLRGKAAQIRLRCLRFAFHSTKHANHYGDRIKVL